MTENPIDSSSETPKEEGGASEQGDSVLSDEAAIERASFPVVGVGASAGGLEAFTQLLQALPPDTGMAFVLVQHLLPTHPSALAEILSRATTMPVTEVHDEPVVEPDHVYVIPPDRSMIIARGALQLLPREVGIHRPVDQFFRSLAEDQRHRAIAVVLSGTATDGTLGLEAIKGEGGITFAQDGTAQHEGMPSSAVASGCVDFVLPPTEIAREIVRIGRHPYAVPEIDVQKSGGQPNLSQIILLLHQATGVDFTHYKLNTLYRRVTRRMVFRKVDSIADYVSLLRKTPSEVGALYQDILISVTSFFRDKESFEALKSEVFPGLLADRAGHDPVRIWTLGCSTGQEAYSLIMAFTEVAEAMGKPVSIQLFATDLNPAAIEKARAGLYAKDIAQDVSPERLRRFFVETDGRYRISKTIRDACVFSRHNVLSDPPFSHIDIVSCRNLLIYLQPVLQQRVIPTLHYALKPGGYLWLGASETIGAHASLFETQDGKHKIYRKKTAPDAVQGHFLIQPGGVPRTPFVPLAARPSERVDLPREADRLLSSRFAPPGVLVSADLEILQFRGNTDPYLTPAPGKASLNLLKMLREGLLVAVRSALLRAGAEHAAVREESLRMRSGSGSREVTVEVIPVLGATGKEGGFLVLFEDAGSGAPSPRENPAPPPAPITPDPDAARLGQELVATREYLHSLIEQQEAANEELQSANEEVQSANEELQSTNEELETSKEEIQSSNEELTTVNDELNNRNRELSLVNNDLVNLLGSIQTAIVMLGPDLRVRRFTPAAEKLLNLIPTDVGRPLLDIKQNLQNLPDLEALLLETQRTASTQERDVQDRSGRWYSMRLRPYRTLDNKIDGVVLMLVDVDAMKRAQVYTESIVATMREPLLVLDEGLRVQTASRAFYDEFRSPPGETVARSLGELGGGQWDIPELRRLLQKVLEDGAPLSDYEVERELPPLGARTMVLNARRLLQPSAERPSILLAVEDITDRRRAESAFKVAEVALQDSELRYRRLFQAAKDGILILDFESGKIVDSNPFMSDLLGYPQAHFLGKELWEIGLFGDRAANEAAVRELQEKGYLRYEHLLLQSREKVEVEVEVVANAYREANRRVIQCNIRDITERSRLEARLKEQAKELADLHRRKDEFLAMLSHELRNPLAPIANAVRLLGLPRGSQSPMQQQACGIIERQVGQLQHLVDDLLEVSRITTGRVQLRRERIAVSAIVERAQEVVQPLIDQRRHKLEVSLPPEPIWLDADAARLHQVLVNLLTNAAKYTNEGGTIGLTVLREGADCVLRVRDTGVGISPELLPHIFDLFTQADRSLDRSQGGLGIGLSLVQRLTELHGGSVEAQSELGKGSEFVVRLPVAPEEAPPSQVEANTADPHTAQPLRVLVVDDNEDAAFTQGMLLESLGHQVATAPDGPRALEEALAFRPDVVLLDIGLPGMDGYEVARKMRQDPALAKVVLVALTGYGQESDRRRSLEAGFDHHLVKPADFEKVNAILELASEKRGLDVERHSRPLPAPRGLG